jgi:hypothetical protein
MLLSHLQQDRIPNDLGKLLHVCGIALVVREKDLSMCHYGLGSRSNAAAADVEPLAAREVGRVQYSGHYCFVLLKTLYAAPQ